jgi:pimeloyl-ACP methyl ester carboxylesterase
MVVSVTLASFQLLAQTHGKEPSMQHPTFYRTIYVDGLSIFYREAGPKAAPTILLLHGVPTSSRMVELYDPDLWTDEYAFLNAPGQAQIQSDLFYDYRTNVDAYPKWQAWLQKTQPKLLVLWGKHDLSFDLGEPERYRNDVPKAEVYVLDAGHFALDTKADEIAALVREFATKEIPKTNEKSNENRRIEYENSYGADIP